MANKEKQMITTSFFLEEKGAIGKWLFHLQRRMKENKIQNQLE